MQGGPQPGPGVLYRSVPGVSTLPAWKRVPLVRVFLTLSYDDVRHTYNSLAAHVTCSTGNLDTSRPGWAEVRG